MFIKSLNVWFADAPVCKPRQKHKFAAKVGDTVEVSCYVEAYPSDNVIFGWLYNGVLDVANGMEDSMDQDVAYSWLNYTVGYVHIHTARNPCSHYTCTQRNQPLILPSYIKFKDFSR